MLNGSPVLESRAVEALDGGDGFGATTTPAETVALLDELLLAAATDDGDTGAVTGKNALVDVVEGADVGVKVKRGSWSSAPEVGCGVVGVVGTGGGCLGLLDEGEGNDAGWWW